MPQRHIMLRPLGSNIEFDTEFNNKLGVLVLCGYARHLSNILEKKSLSPLRLCASVATFGFLHNPYYFL